MRLTVRHKTRYRYDTPLANSMQQLRLIPPESNGQRVLDWSLDAPGMDRATIYTDAFGNVVHMVSMQDVVEDVEVIASGTVETENTLGVIANERGAAPPRIYTRFTQVTQPNQAIRKLGSLINPDDKIAGCHELMHAVRNKVTYKSGVTETHATASSALANGEGVCQDHAHVFIAAARSAGIPARYISGYLLIQDEDNSDAHHAWAEVYIEDLGWLAFDISNGICPTEHYIRLTTGLDSRSAAPIRGIRFGGTAENMNVEVEVLQAAGQQQQ
ncbi:transglutaminase family protein [Roseibium algae]|uniref:Transglutaminase family protein n=1 Tax=Roseibium algae TaxID=3123038 RepID=A0ABU8TST9_9HYPH